MLFPKGKPNPHVWRQTPKATVNPTTGDLKWAAGFLEGEGSFYKNKSNGSTIVICFQVNSWPILRLQELFGGRVKRHVPSAKGREGLLWTCAGPRARGIMMTLFAFLSPRRQDQIKKALAGVLP